MGSVPLAFSVHHFINSVGADAGFASIIGLAILVLLYFAQARETATLRNHAYEAAERIQQLEAEVDQLGRGHAGAGQAASSQPAVAAAQPARVSAPASAAAAARQVPEVAPSAGRLAPLPIAPAGVGAPALSAATKLIPTPSPAPAAAAAASAPASPVSDATVVAAGAVAAPMTAAGAANGNAHDPSGAPRPVSSPSATQAPPPRIQIRPAGTVPPARRPAAPLRSQVPPRSSRFNAGRILLAIAGLFALGGVIALLVVLTSSTGGSSSPNTANTRTSNAAGKRVNNQPAVAPSSVTVAVLNGTATAGLAHRVALNLSGAGYKEGTIATATDQTHTSTTVAYLPGFRRDALAVARSLKLAPSAVVPVDQSTQQVACPGPSACNANVIVTVGANLATTQ
jgi:hypothetical protein